MNLTFPPCHAELNFACHARTPSMQVIVWVGRSQLDHYKMVQYTSFLTLPKWWSQRLPPGGGGSRPEGQGAADGSPSGLSGRAFATFWPPELDHFVGTDCWINLLAVGSLPCGGAIAAFCPVGEEMKKLLDQSWEK